MFSGPPTGSVGQIAHDELRQRKNKFICAATLASRAAIRGGLSMKRRLPLSDSYIQKAELLGDSTSLAKLNVTMLIDFTARVSQSAPRGGYSPACDRSHSVRQRNISIK
jgi:hypothetical protein